MGTKNSHIYLLLALALTVTTSAVYGRGPSNGITALSVDVKKPKKKSSHKKFTPAKKSNASKSVYGQEMLVNRFTSWGIDPQFKSASIHLKGAWERFEKKKEVVVAVVDTGIDFQHPFIQKNIYVPEGKVDPKNFGLDFSKAKTRSTAKVRTTPIDTHGHGTHVSGIIKSVFPDVKILSLKYYNPNATGQENLDSTIAALRYAVESNVDIINYSGGGPEPAAEEKEVLLEAERKGILVVAAAGNEQSDIDKKKNAYYPASYGLKNIITVSAHNKFLSVISSSNWGKKSVDLTAPGYRIKSSLPNNRVGYMTGTSQATAFVTGVAALVKSMYPSFTTPDIKKIIKASVQKNTTLVNKCSTEGSLNATKVMNTAKILFEKLKKAKRQVANKTKNSKKAAKKDQKQKRLFIAY